MKIKWQRRWSENHRRYWWILLDYFKSGVPFKTMFIKRHQVETQFLGTSMTWFMSHDRLFHRLIKNSAGLNKSWFEIFCSIPEWVTNKEWLISIHFNFLLHSTPCLLIHPINYISHSLYSCKRLLYIFMLWNKFIFRFKLSIKRLLDRQLNAICCKC